MHLMLCLLTKLSLHSEVWIGWGGNNEGKRKKYEVLDSFSISWVLEVQNSFKHLLDKKFGSLDHEVSKV
jgi:hypothetical protein